MVVRNLQAAGLNIPYHLKTHRRAKRIKICVRGRNVTVTYPPRLPMTKAVSFVEKNSKWVAKYFKEHDGLGEKYLLPNVHFEACRARALKFVKERVEFWNKFYNFKYKLIRIRRQRTRWGSCSQSGALNFNYKILFLPLEIADYIVVHELCHLKEMNHSRHFWVEVARAVPDYAELLKELKKYNCA
jgi:predicted metal-dependent hydrolase